MQPFRTIPVVLLAAGFAAAAPTGGKPDPEAKKTGPVEVEVRYTDDSTMKLKLLDETIELATKYGPLKIPTADVRRIEFATRLSPATVDKITDALRDLANGDYAVRDKATTELKLLGDRAYPSVLKAARDADTERARRAEEIAEHIRSRAKPADLTPREFDVIHTDDSKIAGRLAGGPLKVSTFQFGELQLRPADVREMRFAGAMPPLDMTAVPATQNLTEFANKIGKELAFSLTGYPLNPGVGQPQQGNVWGTDVYTLDSHLVTAAMHAGLVKPGQTAVVRVKIVPSPPQFVGGQRNGVTSVGYGQYNGGAFEFVAK